MAAVDKLAEHLKSKNCKGITDPYDKQCPICMTRPGKEYETEHENLLDHLEEKHHFWLDNDETREFPDRVARYYCED